MAGRQGSGSGRHASEVRLRRTAKSRSGQVAPDGAEHQQESGDERILQAIARGDREALGALYDRFAADMLAVGKRFLGGAREAEDLVHDVFLEIWHHASQYDPTRGSVRTWLMLRLRSRALDWLRATRRTALVVFEESMLHAASTLDSDSTRQADFELHGRLADLPDEQRIVLELGYFAGYSQSEIAAHLGIPIGTVKSRMSRAIVALRLRLISSEDASAPTNLEASGSHGTPCRRRSSLGIVDRTNFRCSSC